MKYFSFYEIFRSIIYSVGFGAVFGLIATAFAVVFDNIPNLIKIPYRAFAIADKPRNWRTLFLVFKSGENENAIAVEIRDFLYTLFFGISLIFLVYLTSDGIPRVYILITAISTALLSYRLLSTRVRLVFLWLFCRLSALLGLIFAMALFVPKKIVKRFFVPIFIRLKSAFCSGFKAVLERLKVFMRKKGK